MENFADVSVIIPCYNSVGTIKRAVDSVYGQSLRPREVILVDDCSTDDTLNCLYEIQRQYPADWLKVIPLNENVGAGSARNRGWDVAQSSFIAFLDSDDSWHPQKIELQYHWMLDNPEVALTAHGCVQCTSGVVAVIERVEDPCWQKAGVGLLLSNKFSTCTVMLNVELPFRFPEGKRYSEDYQLWLEILLSGYPCFRSTSGLAYLYKPNYGASGLSGELIAMEKGELEAYRNIRAKGHIGIFTYVLLVAISFSKFGKRLIFNMFM